MTGAEFRPIPGFPRYQVNRQGIVQRRSVDKKRRIPEWKTLDGVSCGTTSRAFQLCQRGKRCTFTNRQLVLKVFGTTWPKDLSIHRLTFEQHSNPGERNGNHRLTEPEVREIRALYAAGGWKHQELADEFGVAKGTVGYILRNETWKHLEQTQ